MAPAAAARGPGGRAVAIIAGKPGRLVSWRIRVISAARVAGLGCCRDAPALRLLHGHDHAAGTAGEAFELEDRDEY